MDQQTKVSFSAVDNGVSSFMKRMQADSKAMFADYMKEAQKQTASSKEQLKIIEQQIKALERANKLEKEQSQIILDRKRSAGSMSDSAYKAHAAQLKDDSNTNKLQITILKDILSQIKSEDKPEEKPTPASAKQVFGAILAAGIMRDMFGLFKQTANAKTEFDLIAPAGSVAGATLGAAAGLFMSPGTTQVGKEIGGFVGSAYTRHLIEQERYLGSAYRVRGLTGMGSQAGDLSMFGVDRSSGAQLEESISRAVVRSVNAREIKDVVVLSKAFSLDNNAITDYMSLEKMGSNVNVRQIAGMFIDGIDRSKLGDFVKNTTSLMQLMGQTTLTPNIIAGRQMISEFNSVGGPFTVSDPRSMGLISTIQSNLTNPSSAFAQAMSYAGLRKQNPELGMLDLMIERQKGGVIPLRTMAEDIAAMGGSEDFQVMQFAKMTGLSGNLAAARKLFQSRGNFGVGGIQTIAGAEDMTKIDREASMLTTTISQSQAAVTNAFITSFTAGISELAIRFTDRMGDAIEEVITNKVKKAFDKSSTPPPTPNHSYHKPTPRFQG